jgi:hypothetical protein
VVEDLAEQPPGVALPRYLLSRDPFQVVSCDAMVFSHCGAGHSEDGVARKAQWMDEAYDFRFLEEDVVEDVQRVVECAHHDVAESS